MTEDGSITQLGIGASAAVVYTPVPHGCVGSKKYPESAVTDLFARSSRRDVGVHPALPTVRLARSDHANEAWRERAHSSRIRHVSPCPREALSRSRSPRIVNQR